MNLLRTLLIVWLAVLLPVRGAVAAAWLCQGSGLPAAATEALSKVANTDGSAAEQPSHCHPTDMPTGPGSTLALQAGVSAPDHSASAPSAKDSAQPPAQTATHSGGCHLCASCCSMPPLPVATPSVPAPMVLASVRYPALQAPGACHACAVQERPPRRL